MFFRATPQPAPPAPPAVPAPPPPSRRDKVLPLIPFSPDWVPSDARADVAVQIRITEERTPEVSDSTDLPLILAEADPGSREVLCGLGRKWGYRVVPANDGVEALAAISAQREPALAVINWQMNGLSGIEICRATRKLNRPVYIILVTERSGNEQLADALEAGADDYLITPFDADELRARIGVGARVIGLETQLAAVRGDFEAAAARVEALTRAAEASRVSV